MSPPPDENLPPRAAASPSAPRRTSTPSPCTDDTIADVSGKGLLVWQPAKRLGSDASARRAAIRAHPYWKEPEWELVDARARARCGRGSRGG